ncbi:MAG: primosomal protein N' [Phycisphaerales bacterium]|nr:primosomal protein N' [Phycisphaerales bacterium]
MPDNSPQQALFHHEEPAPQGPFVKVAIERGIDKLASGADTLTYRDPGLDLRPGDMVEAPLGKTAKVGGVVTQAGGPELLGHLSPAKVRPVLRKTGGRIPGSLLELATWLARYYASPLGMALATVTPSAVKKQTGKRTRKALEPTGAEPTERLPPKTREVWERISGLDREMFPVEHRVLAEAVGATSVGPLNRLVRLGLLREVVVERVTSRVRAPGGDAGVDVAPELTVAQREVVEGVCLALGGGLGGFGVHLLRGVTGSGKTEVYLRVIERALEGGKGAIVLVPEIALTPQTSGRFARRFVSHGVAVLHSGLSAAERHRQWAMIASGEARVVVGARSAVFAPVADLGVIVVDEEHDGSYKQDQAPRYNGRDVAIKRGQLEGATVVLGSATPSLESWANAHTHSDFWTLWELPDRVGGGVLPPVKIVDIKEEHRIAHSLGRKGRGAIGPTLAAALERTLKEGGQAILLMNRRGHSTYIGCASAACGWVLACDDCDASMVLHKDGRIRGGESLRCHHCQSEKLLPPACPVCSRGLIRLGFGIQRVEEELRGLVDLASDEVERVDSDTMRTAGHYFRVLDRFAKGDIRLLLGTQMIAKGLDFPNVRLVGVVNADTALSLPDFRAAERTFQLITQVAGRAGRAEHAGEVIVQTASPESDPIRAAARHDFLGFVRGEMSVRSACGLPPASRMARIVVRDQKAERAEAGAAALADLLVSLSPPGVRVQGPMPCTITRIADRFRWEVLLIAPRAGLIQRVLGEARARGELVSDARTAVDVDPVALM